MDEKGGNGVFQLFLLSPRVFCKGAVGEEDDD